jgi:hypothetical protein
MTLRFHLIPVRVAIATKTTNAGEDVGGGRNLNKLLVCIMEINMEVPQKIEARTSLRSCYTTAGYINGEIKVSRQQSHLHTRVYYSTIHHRQIMGR